MFVEQRLYTLKPGATGAFLDFYQRNGRSIQTKVLGHPVGYYSTEIGPLNQVVMNWFYSSLNERMDKRETLAGEPEWAAYLRHARGFVTTQETRILQPAPFFRGQLKAFVAMGGEP